MTGMEKELPGQHLHLQSARGQRRELEQIGGAHIGPHLILARRTGYDGAIICGDRKPEVVRGFGIACVQLNVIYPGIACTPEDEGGITRPAHDAVDGAPEEIPLVSIARENLARQGFICVVDIDCPGLTQSGGFKFPVGGRRQSSRPGRRRPCQTRPR